MDDFKLQLSIKIDGQHLLNIRSDSWMDFGELLEAAVKNAEYLQSVTRAVEGKAPAPVVTTANRPIAALKETSPEFGPVKLAGVERVLLTKTGEKLRSPRFVVTFANGKKISTFDATIGGAAETLAGEAVFYAIEKKGEFTNLINVRKAV